MPRSVSSEGSISPVSPETRESSRPELLEVSGQLLGLRGFRGRQPFLLGQILLESGSRSEIFPPVLDEQPGDVLVPFQMRGFQRDRHFNLQARDRFHNLARPEPQERHSGMLTARVMNGK